MANPGLAPRSALHGLHLSSHIGLVTIGDAGRAGRFVYRGAASDLGDAFGVSLPLEPCRATHSGSRAALWLGPDEWLLLADGEEAGGLTGPLSGMLASKAAILVDVSHRQIGLSITGPKSETLLSSGCPLDLDIARFPVGMCTRTIFAKAEIVLWRRATLEFRLEVWRSFAPYVAGLLEEASGDID